MKKPLTLAGLLTALSLLAQEPNPPPNTSFTGTMPPGDDGPRNHRILSATSKDGLTWAIANESLAEQASVPELFEGPDGKLIAIFVDASGQAARGALGAMVRASDGKWSRTETNLRGADPNVVRLKDGGYRAFTKERDGAIIGFSSRDGLQWERLGVAFQNDRYPNTTDSDVFETPDGWVMLISLGPRMLRCTSSDGVKFATDGTVLELGGSVSDTVKVPGGWRTFFHVNATPQTGGKMLIRSAFTADGRTWRVEEGDRVVAPASGPASLGIADPAPMQLADGSWLMLVKSFIESPSHGGQFARNAGGAPARSSLGVPASAGRDSEEARQPSRAQGRPPEGGTPNVGTAGRLPAPRPPGGGSTPREHEVHSATSKDGLTWTRDEGIRLTSASVPCVINDGDQRILLYAVRPPDEPGGVGGVSCAVSTDGTNFTIDRSFRIEGLSTLTAADPSIVKDEAGKFRLYYLASNHRGDPAHGENPHKINYALSDDGLRFREAGTAFTYDDLVDPDVFRFKSGWFMYVFGKGGTVIATSKDGKSFAFNKTMTPRDWGTVAPVTLPDGRLRLYAFEQRVPIGNAVGSFTSTDGLNWSADAGVRLQAKPDEQITDPFVIPWRGGWKMYFKHSPARTRNFAANGAQNFGGQNSQRPENQNDGRTFPPLPAGEGRGEGERRGQANQVPNNFNAQPPPQNFNTANGPWNNDVIAYRVSASGAVEKVATFERAGVPTVARLKDGRIIAAHQHFPENDRQNFDKVAARFSSDDGKTWGTPQVIQVAGLPDGMRFPFDPTLVPLPDGRVRLYFTGNMGRTFQRSTPAIHSAISTDGVNYTYEPGVRFDVAGRAVIDCAVVLHNGVFHLYAPDNGAGDNPGDPRNRSAADRPREGIGYHATSRDGLNFTRADDVQIEGRRRWLGNAQSDGKQIIFFGTGEGFSASQGERPRGGLWMATSPDGQSWKLTSSPAVGGADPGAVATRDGGWLIVVTGPPVRGDGRSAGGPPARGNDEFGVPASAGRDADNIPRSTRERTGPPEGGTPNFAAGGPPTLQARREIRVETTGSKYQAAPDAKAGSFVTGQDADLMLGGFGFNKSGGALAFNHPTGLATDGKALLMTDRWNNRVLIWKSAPAKNTPPDLVLGQPDFTQNHPGAGKHQLNWPGNVTISPDGKRIAVTDTSNDRILIWNSFPTKNGQAADLVLDLTQLGGGGAPAYGPAGSRDGAERRASLGQNGPAPSGRAMLGAPNANSRPQVGRGIQRYSWPWGVWTDGTKLAAVATHGSAVLVWNSFPTRDNQSPDFVLRPDGVGTPRNVTSDGKTFFAVSDHNYGDNSRPATMVWNSFPTSAAQPPDWTWREWVKGSFTPGGGLTVAGIQSIYLFNKPPRDAETDADVVLRPATYRNGDGPDAVVANGRLYVCTYNGNHILGWNALPTRDNQPADFALGSDRTDQDTWAENFFIQNAVVATDGKSLFVTSDFDRKMFVWRNLPDESAAKPDLVMHLPDGPWDNELHGSTLALAGRSSVSIWRKLPLNGESPDVVLSRRIGSAELGELTGVAFDDKYFYLSDRRNECIYVWEGIPNQDSEPKFTLEMRSPGRLTSDGNYLCAAPFEGGGIQLWRVNELGSRAEPITLGGRGQFNLPSECLMGDGRLFVANRSFNRVDVWNRVEDALAGQPADALLGATGAQDRAPATTRNKMFMPGSLAWGGGYLWVGEFKFSTRILRFSPSSGSATAARGSE